MWRTAVPGRAGLADGEAVLRLGGGPGGLGQPGQGVQHLGEVRVVVQHGGLEQVGLAQLETPSQRSCRKIQIFKNRKKTTYQEKGECF